MEEAGADDSRRPCTVLVGGNPRGTCRVTPSSGYESLYGCICFKKAPEQLSVVSRAKGDVFPLIQLLVSGQCIQTSFLFT